MIFSFTTLACANVMSCPAFLMTSVSKIDGYGELVVRPLDLGDVTMTVTLEHADTHETYAQKFGVRTLEMKEIAIACAYAPQPSTDSHPCGPIEVLGTDGGTLSMSFSGRSGSGETVEIPIDVSFTGCSPGQQSNPYRIEVTAPTTCAAHAAWKQLENDIAVDLR